MEKDNLIDEFSDIVEFLFSKNIEIESIYSFIRTNYDLLNENRENLIDNLFLIKNNKNLYCILLTRFDKYYWSLYRNKVFEPFKCIDDDKNIIVENLVDFTSSEKVQSVYPDILNLPLNKRVKKLNKCGINTKGYHFELNISQ